MAFQRSASPTFIHFGCSEYPSRILYKYFFNKCTRVPGGKKKMRLTMKSSLIHRFTIW